MQGVQVVFRNARLESPEWITALYEKWGCDFARHLRGEFAIALWDPDLNQHVLARDPLGVKPFYYFWNGEKFIFSSKISGIFAADASIPKKPNHKMIGQFLCGEFLDPEATFFEGIYQVLPGHTFVLKDGQTIRKNRFWAPQQVIARRYSNQEEYYEEFFYIFQRAVKTRLQTDQKEASVGLLLSGGLDSVQVCAMAESLRQKESSLPSLKSVCLTVEGFLAEEKMAIECLEKQYRSDIELIDFSVQQKQRSMFELFLEIGETPHLDCYLTNSLLLENLSKRNAKVLLTGFGANELSNPMELGYLTEQFLNLNIQKFRHEVERYALCAHLSPKEVRQIVYAEALKEKTPLWARRLLREKRNAQRKWLRPGFRKKMDREPPLRLRPFGRLSQDKSYEALFEPLISLGLAQMEESAERFGMEIRHPFLDLRLVEFFLSIPPQVKLADGYRKGFIQRSLEKIMPFPVKKADNEKCHIPFAKKDVREKIERMRLQKFLARPQSLLYDYVDYRALHKMLRLSAINFPFFWRLVRLEVWLENHFGKGFFNDCPELSLYNPAETAAV